MTIVKEEMLVFLSFKVMQRKCKRNLVGADTPRERHTRDRVTAESVLLSLGLLAESDMNKKKTWRNKGSSDTYCLQTCNT